MEQEPKEEQISEIDNWFEWLAARIPNLKTTGAYKFWIKQAMEEYANHSYKFWQSKYRAMEEENKELKSKLESLRGKVEDIAHSAYRAGRVYEYNNHFGPRPNPAPDVWKWSKENGISKQ